MIKPDGGAFILMIICSNNIQEGRLFELRPGGAFI